MKFLAHPAYKLSGVEWLGEIPEHWEVKRLKFVCQRSAVYGANEPSSNYAIEGVRFLRTSDIDDDGNLKQESAVFLDPTAVTEYLLEDGDILFSRSGTLGRTFVYEKARHGDCAYAGYLVRFSLRQEYSPHFVFYFTKSAQFVDWLRTSAIESTIGNVNGQKYANIPIAFPPLHEQRAIAAFLDGETSKIDALIAKKERHIELLQEKRTALISHAVTKGLDPNAPMKDSGVEWPTAIPAHWETKPFGAVARLQRGHDLTVQERNEGNIPVISSSGMSGFHDVAKAKGPGVITGRYGTIGEIYYIDEDYWPMNTTLYVRNFNGNLPRYIYYLLKLLPFDAYSGKSAVPGIDRNDLHRVAVVCPPEQEQRAIAAYLDRETAKIDALIAKVQQAIETLKEYRTALISAAVTGKIDVRGLS